MFHEMKKVIARRASRIETANVVFFIPLEIKDSEPYIHIRLRVSLAVVDFVWKYVILLYLYMQDFSYENNPSMYYYARLFL